MMVLSLTYKYIFSRFRNFDHLSMLGYRHGTPKYCTKQPNTDRLPAELAFRNLVVTKQTHFLSILLLIGLSGSSSILSN